MKTLETKLISAMNHNSIRLINILVALVFFSHWNGCIQFIIATFDTQIDPATGAITLHPDTWIVRAGIADEREIIQWSWSFYHAMTQLLAISVGVVDPMRIAECWCYLVSMVGGATLYAFFVASLTSVFSEMGGAGRMYRAKIDQLEHYMRHHHLPKEMRIKMRAYYELCFPGRTMFDAEEIVSGLSHPLRGQIALIQCRGVLESLQVLHDERLSRAIASKLERIVFVDGDYVIYEGEDGRGLYFIFEGTVEVLARSKKPLGGAGTTDGTTPMAGSMAGVAAAAHQMSGFARKAPTQPEVVLTRLGAKSFFGANGPFQTSLPPRTFATSHPHTIHLHLTYSLPPFRRDGLA